jgi:2-oxoglutarate dehydrogenase complex dehydrogenase (E1) component-like enzyme
MEELGRKGPLRYTGRKASASPAAGQMSQHQAELQAFLVDALTL